MQPSARTPSSILRKRQSQEEQNRRKSLRARGRRVSFAPDDELETRHLFSIDKGSPALPPSQDTQPLGGLQNQMPPPPAHDFMGPAAAAGGKWGPYDKLHAGQGDQDLLVRPQHNSLQQPEAYLLSPEPAGTPQSMDLTNDTMQNPGGIGGFPGFSLRDENDSIEFGAAGHGGDMQAGGLFAGRDGTYNITGDVPKLSALLEEDEEGDETRGATGSGDEAESEGVAMELTGNTMHTPAGPAAAAAAAVAASEGATPDFASPRTRRRSRGSAAADAAAPAASPAASPTPRRSSRRSSAQQDLTPPGLAAGAADARTPVSPARSTPRRRGHRSSTAAAGACDAAAAGTAQPEQDSTPHTLVSPRRGRSSIAAAGAASAPGSALKGHHAPSLDPTPSPLRRITRSMASPLASPVLGSGGGAGAGAGAFDGLTEGFTEKLLSGAVGGGAGMGGGGGSRRSSINRFAEQQSRWGFVPGEEDTLNINMNMPGAGGLGDTTLHHVYSDSAGTGELTASMKPGQHQAVAGAGPGLRAGSRRRSSVGQVRRAMSSLAAEVIPEETATPQPPSPAAAASGAAAVKEAEFTFDTGAAAGASRACAAAAAAAAADSVTADSPLQQQLGGTEPLDTTAAAAVTPAHGAAGDFTQEMDMDISVGLGGATPGLLGDSHLTPMYGWSQQQQQQQAPMQQHKKFDMVPESPEGAAAGPADACADDDAMNVDSADENAPLASPGDSPAAAAAADVDGLTTSLLLDDHRQLGGWGHVPLGGTEARPSLGGAGGLTTHTGRGSVGSNVLTMHSHRFVPHTTQLLADSATKEARHADHSAAAAGRGRQSLAPRHSTTPAAGAGAGGYDDCTTKLLADSTSASACGIMGMLPQQQRVRLLHSSTIAGGALVLHRTGGPFGRQQQQYEEEEQEDELREEEGLREQAHVASQGGYQMSPELGPRPGSRLADEDDADMVDDSQPEADAAAAEADAASPIEHWNQPRSSQKQRGRSSVPAASPARNTRSAAAAAAAAGQSPDLVLRPLPLGGVAAAATAATAAAAGARGCSREADEPTLELAAGVTAGMSGLGGQSLLEDATLEDFALPPDMMGAAEERPITMPFSGALPPVADPVGHTPGGSVLRSAQPITFSDFCQVVDMQFLTHIRRGTSISVCDFAPSSLPQDLSKALELLSVTSCEVSVLEAAMHDLQAEMHTKRREAYEQEDRLGTDNPPVFATVQTSRPTQLEQTKHCLVLHKKACRSQTASSWKALRVHMEQQLADKLAQQQADLDEQLAFVQAKLQKAQQQREYAKAFHADVLKKLAAEDVAQQEATAARARLVCLRSRLAELRCLNADRQQRASELQERVAETEAKRADFSSELAALRSRREQLSSVVASTPRPAASQNVLKRLQQASEQVQLLECLQGCKLVGDGAGSCLLNFCGLLGVQMTIQHAAAAEANSGPQVSGRLVLLSAEAAAATPAKVPAEGALKLQLLQQMVAALQSRCSFLCVPGLVREALTEAEAVASRALELAGACQEVYLSQPLLTGVSIKQNLSDTQQDDVEAQGGDQMQVDGEQAQHGSGSEGCGELVLTVVEPDAKVKVEVALRLRDLLAHAHPGASKRTLAAAVQLRVAPKVAAAGGLQERLQAAVSNAADVTVTQTMLLQSVCEAAVAAIKQSASDGDAYLMRPERVPQGLAPVHEPVAM